LAEWIGKNLIENPFVPATEGDLDKIIKSPHDLEWHWAKKHKDKFRMYVLKAKDGTNLALTSITGPEEGEGGHRYLDIAYVEGYPAGRKIHGVGVLAMAYLVRLSMQMGLKGRTQLWAIPDSRGFYKRIGMMTKDGKAYYFSPRQAKKFLRFAKNYLRRLSKKRRRNPTFSSFTARKPRILVEGDKGLIFSNPVGVEEFDAGPEKKNLYLKIKELNQQGYRFEEASKDRIKLQDIMNWANQIDLKVNYVVIYNPNKKEWLLYSKSLVGNPKSYAFYGYTPEEAKGWMKDMKRKQTHESEMINPVKKGWYYHVLKNKGGYDIIDGVREGPKDKWVFFYSKVKPDKKKYRFLEGPFPTRRDAEIYAFDIEDESKEEIRHSFTDFNKNPIYIINPFTEKDLREAISKVRGNPITPEAFISDMVGQVATATFGVGLVATILGTMLVNFIQDAKTRVETPYMPPPPSWVIDMITEIKATEPKISEQDLLYKIKTIWDLKTREDKLAIYEQFKLGKKSVKSRNYAEGLMKTEAATVLNPLSDKDFRKEMDKLGERISHLKRKDRKSLDKLVHKYYKEVHTREKSKYDLISMILEAEGLKKNKNPLKWERIWGSLGEEPRREVLRRAGLSKAKIDKYWSYRWHSLLWIKGLPDDIKLKVYAVSYNK
jgi:hypothetical protein